MPKKLNSKTTGNPQYGTYNYGNSANVKESESVKYSKKGSSGKRVKTKKKMAAY